MIIRYFLGAEAFVILGYLLGCMLFPKRYSLVFYKFFGVTLFSILVWYLALFTGATWMSLIPWALFLYCLAIIVVFILRRKRFELPSKEQFRTFLAVELISVVIYLLLVYLRTFKPDIIGTEKFMDVALINALNSTGHIPLENPWLSGFLMNYYYFGHFILASLQYLTQVPSSIGYNLAISLIGVWIVQAAYVVARSLRLNDLQALITGLVVTFGGNLYMLIQSISSPKATAWFASATRVIPYTINEFPSYSVILGDLHGHYLSYPFFLIGIFLLIDIFFGSEKHEEHLPEKAVFLGLLLGPLYLTNSWDVLTLGVIGAIFALWYVYLTVGKNRDWTWPKLGRWLLIIGGCVAAASIPQFLLSRLYYLPPVGGVGVNSNFSPLGDEFILFGQFFIIGALSVWIFSVIYPKVKNTLKFEQKETLLIPALICFTAILLVLLVEFVYAKDVFSVLNPPYSRTNTVFKIYFHAWALFSLSVMAAFWHVNAEAQRVLKRSPAVYAYQFIVVIVLAVMLSYPVISVQQYLGANTVTAAWQRITDPSWSNGYTYMQEAHGEDLDIVNYLAAKPHTTILEIITNDSYSYYARISAYTGQSAVSGWPLHNVQWYNGYDGKGLTVVGHHLQPILIASRVADIETMYTNTDAQLVESLLEKYHVTYVVFGAQERTWADENSKTLNSEVYDKLCKTEWQKNDSIIYNCSK